MNLDRLFPDEEGYLADPETGIRAVFYPCDPEKNTLCDHAMCRDRWAREDDREMGFCACTQYERFRLEGGEPFWLRLDGEGQYQRVYLEVVSHDKG